MQVKIVGTANLAQPEAQFAALTGQVEALNRAMAKTAMVPAGGTVQGFQQQSRALKSATNAYNTALSASGKYRVEQLRLNDVVDKQVGLMQKQKLSARDMWGSKESRAQMKAMYRDQLAMQNMVAKATQGNVTDGRLRASLAIPTEVHKSWDTLGNRIGFVGHQLSSASGALVNWGKNTQWAGRQLTAGISMPIAAFGAAAGVLAYQVDKQMTRIQKVYDTTANQNSKSAEEQMAVDKEMAQIRTDAYATGIDAAKKYGAALTDTLSVQAELAATGQKGAQLQKNTSEIMRISMLGEIDQADTTKALIALQNTLGLTTKETSDAFNYMNAVENATSLSMADFAVAIPKAAAPIKLMGGDLKDMGTLLVAMKSQGIGAAEGANAIKAMMQRLYRPSKQIKEEWLQIAHIDLDKMMKETGGDIMKILPRIAAAVKTLNKPDKNKALAGLFGTYQVTRMNAMLTGLDAMKDKTSQTYKAIQVAGNSAEKNAQIAQQEQDRAANSASGQFKRTLQTLKAEMAQIGDPFLEVATKFLKAFSMIAKAFNSLPDPVKKIGAVTAIIVALFGPVVMLTGLFANFVGTMGKMVAATIKAVTNFELLTKAQVGERIAAALTTAEFEKEATAAEVLTAQVMALNDAMMLHTKVMAEGQGIGIGGYQEQVTGRSKAIATMGPNSKLATQIYGSTMGTTAGSKQFNFIPPTTIKPGKTAAELGMNPKEMERAYATNAKYNEQMAATSAKIAENSAKTSKYMQGAAVAGGAFAAGMVLTMTRSDKASQNIGQMLMMLSLIVPSVKAAGAGVKVLGERYTTAANAAKLAAAESAAGGAATAGAAAAGGKFAGSIKGAAAGFAGLMGPVGWITAGIAVAGFGIYKWLQHEKEITKEKLAQNDAVMKQNALANDALKTSQKAYATISTPSATSRPGESTAADVAAEIKGTKDGKSLIAKMRDDETSKTEKATIATEGYVQVLNSTGGTAMKAQRYVEGLYLAAGDGALEAQIKAQQVYDNIGASLTSPAQAKLWADLGAQTMDDWGLGATKRGTDIGKQLADSIAKGTNANTALDDFGKALDDKWGIILNQVGDSEAKVFNELGINSGAALKKATDAWDKAQSDMTKNPSQTLSHELGISLSQAQDLNAALMIMDNQHRGQIEALRKVEAGTVQELARQLGLSDKQIKAIKTRNDLEKTYNYQLLGATKKNAEDLYKLELARQKLRYGTPGTNDPAKIEEVNAKKLKLAQMAAAAAGLEVSDNLSQQEIILKNAAVAADDTANSIDDAATASKKFKDELSGIPKYLRVAVQFDNKDMLSFKKSGMEGVTNDIADAASAGFDNRMNAALAAVQSTWDKRLAAAQARGERQANALDNRWQRIQNQFEKRWDRRKTGVEKYYDARINGVQKQIDAEQKAEDARQKIFQAEQTRIQRLSEMANSTIDFNVALRTGQLDEAAKIKNDMEAKTQDWILGDAAGASQDKSAARVEALNKSKDNYEKDRDNALKALEQKEKDEKASLDRREKKAKAALDRRTKAEQAALQAQATAAQAAAQQRWNMEKASFDQRINLFKSYIARDQKDLERWMKSVGLSYDQFGGNLKAKGEQWSTFFETSMVQHMREAGLKMASDNMWAGLGAQNAREIARGMGFKNMNQFKNFIVNGTMPKTFGQNLNKPTTQQSANGVKNNGGTLVTKGGTIFQHGGGWIGQEKSNRRGVARHVKGAHPSEVPIMAKKGEFLINSDAAKRLGDTQLNALNKGHTVSDPSKGRFGTGGEPLSGMAGILLGGMSNGLMQGIGAAMKGAVAKKQAEITAESAFGALYSITGGGMFSDRAFSKTQLTNAATIASVGSGMGMSKRDIEIGIMAAITESGLVNISGGDRDSAGLFQQRPSQGWGTYEQVTNPQYAARKFFSALSGVAGRNKMSPWLAAQAVQRSAFSDGSNYHQYWDNAIAIMEKGLVKSKNGYSATSGGATGGSGGWQKPSVPGRGWLNSHDYRNPLHTPLYAYNDGRIVESRAIRQGGSGEASGAYPRGYASYGVTVVVQGKDGNKVRYAHGWPGTNAPVGPVTGGAKIMESAATGNATGPHTHFEVNGQEIAREWFAAHGIGLRKGGHVAKDGMANIHKGEAVISPKKTKTLYQSLTTFGDIMNKVGRTVKLGMGGPFGGLYPGESIDNAATAGAAAASSSSSGGSDTNVPDSGKATSVKTASLNTWQHTTAKQTLGDIMKLANSSNIMALSEIMHKPGLGAMLGKRGWGLYTGGHETGVAWNKSVYDALKLATVGINPKHFGKAGLMHRYAAYGLFQDKKSGRQFYQVSLHTVPHLSPGHTTGTPAQRRAIEIEQHKNMQQLFDKLRSTGKPVIMGGDINRSTNNFKGAFYPGGRNTYMNLASVKGGTRKVIGQGAFNSDSPAILSKFNLPQLAKGAMDVKFDNTLANLHKGEAVLTADINEQFKKGVENFASGGQSVYNVGVTLNGANMDPDDVANVVIRKIKATEARKPVARR